MNVRASKLVITALISSCAALLAACDKGKEAPPAPSASAPAASSAPPAEAPKPRCGTDMVFVPGGEFSYGEPAKNQPKKIEKVAEFCIDRTEVTVDAYAACFRRGKCLPIVPSAEFAVVNSSCNLKPDQDGKHPVNCIDFDQARVYCDAMGGRLPTEVEWEYAARGPDGRRYPWGEDAPKDQLCWKPNASSHTCPVGSYPAGNTPLGIADMAGNVWEWVSSPYGFTGDARGIRGGSWDNGKEEDVRPSHRYGDVKRLKTHFLGFRCAKAPPG